MKKENRKREILVYEAAVFLFLGFSFFYGIKRIYGFTIYPDEFGYWSSAAKVLGYDWSEVVAYGNYYSFGYGLILTPILWACGNALTAYRIALGVNAVLLAASFLLLKKISDMLFARQEALRHVLIAGIAVCYPTWLLYVNMTMAEVLLVFCFILVCSLFLRYTQKPSFGRFAAAAAVCVYTYTVHMRTLPILISGIGCLLFLFIRQHKGAWRKILLAVLFVAAAVCAAGVLKTMVQSGVYGKMNKEALSVNDYGGQVRRIKTLLSVKGLTELLISTLGKVFYLTYASFGLFAAGIGYACRKIFDRTAKTEKRVFYFFIVLSVIGEILLCAISAKGYWRIDVLCYGRYDELILPVVMAIGCYALLQMKYPVLYLGASILCGLPAVALTEHLIMRHKMTDINGGYFIAGFSYLLKWIPFEPRNYFWKAYLLSVILMTLLILIIMMVRKNSCFTWLLAVWIGAEAILGIGLNEDMVYRHGRERYLDRQMAARIAELKSADGQTRERRIVCYGREKNGMYISFVQFELRREEILFVSPEEKEKLREDDLIVVFGSEEDRTYLEKQYAKWNSYGMFCFYYNQ